MLIWFYASVFALVAGVLLSVWVWRSPPSSGRIRRGPADGDKTQSRPRHSAAAFSDLNPFHVFAVGQAIAVYLLLFPMVSGIVSPRGVGWLGAALGTVYATVQAFTAGIGLVEVLENFQQASSWLLKAKYLYTALLLAAAPLVTISFLLTFFQAFSTYARCLLSRRNDVNVFSELNERSVALADSLRSNDAKAVIIFMGVVLANNVPSADLIAQARGLGAICFKKGVLSFPIRLFSRQSKIRMFILGSDDREDVWCAATITKDPRYAKRDETDLYVFSDTVEGELALRYRSSDVHVRRIDPARLLVYDWLWRDRGARPAGLDLFENAAPEGSNRLISAAIIGLGGHGREMLKALSWYTQMDFDDGSYRLRINAYDQDPEAEGRFKAACPELLQAGHEQISRPRQDAFYEISVHGGVDATDAGLVDTLLGVDPLTFVFISVGDDSRNMQIATEIRRGFARQSRPVHILVISRNSKTLAHALGEETVRRKADDLPRIELIGDLAEVYNYDTVIHSVMELNGLTCHMAWADREKIAFAQAERTFWEDEYSYSSSIAVPIHWRARRALGIPGACVPSDQRSLAQKNLHRRLEHARWCAFIRSEGFIRADVKDVAVAQTHPLLVEYDALPAKQHEKDDNDSQDTLRAFEAELADPTVDVHQKADSLGALRDLVARVRPAVLDAEASQVRIAHHSLPSESKSRR